MIPILENKPTSKEEIDARSNYEKEKIIKEIFHLDSRPCTSHFNNKGNCQDNPKCIIGFGEKSEGIWNQSKGEKKKIREENTYIGLRNLGATCYMNSLLQALFMDKQFRSIIFNWKAHSDNKKNLICTELQVLFAQLQLSQMESISPESIANLLQIQPQIQQDLQEFHNLFISHLEDIFSKSEDEEVKNYVTNELKGKSEFITKCSCHYNSRNQCSYNEIQISLNKKTLEDGLKELLKPEELRGANKYMCDGCNKLSDATREFKFATLPKVLKFQLLRFAYDPYTGNRKKISSQFSFPMILDMNQFLDPSMKSEDNKYELTGVLLHLGESANGGHYIAHLLDDGSGIWWRFNDSIVSKIEVSDIPDFKSNNSNNYHYYSYNNFRPNELKSENAYMLIYTKHNSDIIPTPSPPSFAVERVEKTNEAYLKQITEQEMWRMKMKEEYNTHKEVYERVMRANYTNYEKYYWIDKFWFSDWVKGKGTQISNRSLLCEHGKVSPLLLHKMKLVPESTWVTLNSIYDSDIILSVDDCCIYCAAPIYDENKWKEEQKKK